jgi:hypothetical protein
MDSATPGQHSETHLKKKKKEKSQGSQENNEYTY